MVSTSTLSGVQLLVQSLSLKFSMYYSGFTFKSKSPLTPKIIY